ncbi:uncharacterized protein LOC110816176 isoform X2 [Carica papaya]|uniref:uncharacterized protein LOC110816176 isoform X2 n=1 Tax=Carica papaya TaxID=3649 RepID=UPI000B8D0D93|nr:uncharacterized protein LOC110816176 isoform X2 [Carica papaya]
MAISGFENFEPIFGEPKTEFLNPVSDLPPRFLFHLFPSDHFHLTLHVTDFRFHTWEAVRSVSQLEDMRDAIGIGGSWSEFVDYMVASIESEEVKLVIEGNLDSNGATFAKLVAQKAKGMPRMSFPLRRIDDSAAAAEAMAKLSMQLFEAFKRTQHLLLQEKEHSLQLTKMLSAEKEKYEGVQSQLELQLELHMRKKKLQKINSLDKLDASASPVSNAQNSPDKHAAKEMGSTRVANRIVPAHRRTRTRGVVLQDSGDEEDN